VGWQDFGVGSVWTLPQTLCTTGHSCHKTDFAELTAAVLAVELVVITPRAWETIEVGVVGATVSHGRDCAFVVRALGFPLRVSLSFYLLDLHMGVANFKGHSSNV